MQIKRLLNISLLLTSLIGYLEWGGNNHAFLFQVECDLIFSSKHDSNTFLHPFILVPLCGQLMILYSIFQKTPGKIVSLVGLICLSIIMLFLFFIGLLGLNIKTIMSAIPFIITGILIIRYNRQRSSKA